MRAVLLACAAAAASGCGFTVHQVIAKRALENFLQPGIHAASPRGYASLLQGQRGALLAGAPFPDYLYACGSNHDDGEYAHWSTFQGHGADYVRAFGAGAWNTSQQQVVAFLHGVVSHYIADINWHGLAEVRGGLGFIQSVGMMDYNTTGLDSTAHSECDTGAEFVAAYSSDLAFLAPEAWVVPTADLVAIFALAQRKIDPAAIEECAAIFYAGTLAIKYLSALVEPLETAVAPTLVERWADLPLGGVDDMAVFTGRMWTRLQGWIEVGPPSTFPDDDGSGAHAHARASLPLRQLVSSSSRYAIAAPKIELVRFKSCCSSCARRPSSSCLPAAPSSSRHTWPLRRAASWATRSSTSDARSTSAARSAALAPSPWWLASALAAATSRTRRASMRCRPCSASSSSSRRRWAVRMDSRSLSLPSSCFTACAAAVRSSSISARRCSRGDRTRHSASSRPLRLDAMPTKAV